MITDNDNLNQEEVDMASQNHAVTQFRLGVQLASLGKEFEGATELSLDIGTPERQEILKKHGLGETRELKPDLVLYRATDLGFIKASKGADKVRVMAPPLLCVEIISPSQGAQEIINKFKVYFDIGVKSCWYIDPTLEIALVYKESLESEAFHNTDLNDSTLGINIPLNKVFY
jgi:Uma2 family endonuclease